MNIERVIFMLEIKKVHILYEKELFHPFDFQCCPGQITAISGESGSGKTSILRVIAQKIKGYEQYTIDGKVCESNELWQNLYYVEQDPLLEEDLTIREHLDLLYEYYHLSQNLQLEEALSEQLEIDHVFSLYPNMLSDGEKKRCALFMACLSQRNIILLDEPTASVNKDMIQQELAIIQTYLKDSAVIISTHDSEILEISDVIYTIDHGVVSCTGMVENKAFIHNENHKKSDLMKYYWKTFKHHKAYHIIAQCLITFSICILILGLFSIDVYVDQQKERLNSLFTNQFVVYKPTVQGAAYEQNEYPLTDEELTKLKEMKAIKSIRELYCFTESNTSEIKLGNRNVYMSHEESPIDYISYDDTRDVSSYVEQAFQNQGVYITRELADKIGTISQGDQLTFAMPVPQYNVFNEGYVADNNDISKPSYYIVYPEKNYVLISLPIAGIIKDDNAKMGMAVSTVDDAIYIPQSIYQEQLLKVKVSDSYQEENVEYEPYRPNAYVIELTSVNDIAEFKSTLDNMGLGCDSQYFDVYSYIQTEEGTRHYHQMIAFTLMLGITLLIFVLKYLKRKNDQQFFVYIRSVFNDAPLTRSLFIKSILYRAVFDFLIAMLCCFTILIFASKVLDHTYTLPLYSYLICFLFSLLIEGFSIICFKRNKT